MNNDLFEKIIAKVNFSILKKTPVILQSEAAECGIACLAMVCVNSLIESTIALT